MHKRLSETRYIVQLDTTEGWVTVEATYYRTDAERWAKHYCAMCDDPTVARVVEK
jgi:hypothetical protein